MSSFDNSLNEDYPNCLVYGLVCPVLNKIRYIGSTTLCDISDRLKKHIEHPVSMRMSRWFNFLETIGKLNDIKMVVICPDVTRQELYHEERRQIIDHHIMGHDLLNRYNNPQRSILKISLGNNQFKSIYKKHKIVNNKYDLELYKQSLYNEYGGNIDVTDNFYFCKRVTDANKKRPNKA